MKTTLLPFFVIVLLAVTACSQSNRQNPRDLSEEEQNIDQIVWNATFQDLEGNEVSVADFEGKVVLLDFWESWCGPCLQVFPAIDSLQNEYPEDFVVIAVNLNSSDTREDVISFREKNNYDFVYTLDHENVGNRIIKQGIPFKVYMDPNGYLITTELGFYGGEGDYRKTKEIIEQNKTS